MRRFPSPRRPVEISPYSSAHHDAVDRLNSRMAEAGSTWSLPRRERPAAADALAAWDESFVATEGGEVYGGYVLKHRRFYLAGEAFDVGALQMPLSLGEVDSAYAHVGVALLFDAIRRSPHLYSLGLGSEETQFARLLRAAEWRHITVPFLFSVKNANRFAREIRLPAGKATLQRALRALGHARLAGGALALRRAAVRRGGARPRATEARVLTAFDGSIDALFAANRGSYLLVADRSEDALRALFPVDDDRFLHLLVVGDDAVIGWALVLDTPMTDNAHFGNLRVGTIVDCLGAFEDAAAVVAAADAFLARRGVDVVVSNQLHPVWIGALEANGYERGPSNFFFYFSEQVAERLGATPGWERSVHLNRGDGEGPAHLL